MKNQRIIAKVQLEKLVRYFEQNIHQLKAPPSMKHKPGNTS